ncbi:EVE domain-containing protein [Amycolatopsis thailandensis]|uniref:EVE domain-containing protein n=1 Tax=Amycolatopsis thailandensis TaxID=589330 RepID=UPI0037B9DF94
MPATTLRIMNDRQLVLQPRGGASLNGPANFARSVRRGVPLAELADVLGADLAALTTLYPDGAVRLWGSTPAASTGNAKALALRDRRVGDRVLFYADKAFVAEATIKHLLHNRQVAERVWGTDGEGRTWEHIMALGDVREFQQPIPADRILSPLGMALPLRSLTLVSATKHSSVASLVANNEPRQPRHWILQCNPKKWDVWSWWEQQAETSTTWTVDRHLDDLHPGDSFALWVAGPGGGVCALGTFTSGPYPTSDFDEHWVRRPERRQVIDVRLKRFLFDRPITRQDLMSDPAFTGALIIRMPGTANPIPLKPGEWAAIELRAGNARRPVSTEPAKTVVTSRPVGSIPEATTANNGSGPREIGFPEAKLVKQYEDFVDNELRCLSALLPSGERLVCDLFDPAANTLIEAKASNSRQDVRMALGQLLDYRHHIKPDAELAVLLPDRPAPSIIEVLHAHGVTLIHPHDRGFRSVVPEK